MTIKRYGRVCMKKKNSIPAKRHLRKYWNNFIRVEKMFTDSYQTLERKMAERFGIDDIEFVMGADGHFAIGSYSQKFIHVFR